MLEDIKVDIADKISISIDSENSQIGKISQNKAASKVPNVRSKGKSSKGSKSKAAKKQLIEEDKINDESNVINPSLKFNEISNSTTQDINNDRILNINKDQILSFEQNKNEITSSSPTLNKDQSNLKINKICEDDEEEKGYSIDRVRDYEPKSNLIKTSILPTGYHKIKVVDGKITYEQIQSDSYSDDDFESYSEEKSEEKEVDDKEDQSKVESDQDNELVQQMVKQLSFSSCEQHPNNDGKDQIEEQIEINEEIIEELLTQDIPEKENVLDISEVVNNEEDKNKFEAIDDHKDQDEIEVNKSCTDLSKFNAKDDTIKVIDNLNKNDNSNHQNLSEDNNTHNTFRNLYQQKRDMNLNLQQEMEKSPTLKIECSSCSPVENNRENKADLNSRIEIEEKKINLNIETSEFKSKLTPLKYSKETYSYKDNKNRYKHNSYNKNYNRNKNKYNNERKHHRNYYNDAVIDNIPDKAINSFYQLDNEDFYNQGENIDQSGYDHNNQSYNNQYDNQYYSYNNTEYYEGNEINPQSDPINHAHTYQMRHYECELYLYDLLSKEMEQETLEITKQVNLVKDYRQDIKNQIEKCAISVFGDTHLNVEAHIYGSVATGLALLESDMDIVITGVNNYDNKDKHISNLTELYNKIKSEFSSQILTMSKQILFTQVPIIKLEFSLKDYYSKRIEDDISALPYIEFDSESCINPILRKLNVDTVINQLLENIHIYL